MGYSQFDSREKQTRFIEMREGGKRISECCRALGITVAAYRYQLKHSTWFSDQVEMLELERVEDAEEALADLVKKGSIEAVKFTLTNRAADEWTNKKVVEHTGEGVNPIRVAEHNTNVIFAVLEDPARFRTALDFIDRELVPKMPDAIEATASDR